jgi:hypothetical protein
VHGPCFETSSSQLAVNLQQLSVGIARKLHKRMVGAAGIEPATLGLEIRCSIRLSYAPGLRIPLILQRRCAGSTFAREHESERGQYGSRNGVAQNVAQLMPIQN